MASLVNSFAVQGVNGYVVEIESTLIHGRSMISIIGLGDQAVKEAAERIRSALVSSSYDVPQEKIIINLAPGDIKKRGSHYDLGMAIGLLVASGQLKADNLHKYGFVGELSLNGQIRGCNGILPMMIAAKENGIQNVIVPVANYEEASLTEGINIIPVGTLNEAIDFLLGKKVSILSPHHNNNSSSACQPNNIDYSDVIGQKETISSMVLAAAGGHNLLMIGKPGCGKTMLAQRLPTILPDPTEEEMLEIIKIQSLSGSLQNSDISKRFRPFRAPHHNISLNALIGGGNYSMPGEVTLAHNGVLFLDELTEFSKKSMEALRQPLENHIVSISRVSACNTYPANFLLIGAMNPCPCGYYPSKKCRCTDYEILKYRNRISGPILERFDLQKIVPSVR